ncbi:chymotrypsin-1-like [Prorops nasuta]|uniref:chymotrypsin-1-like n=1 Tax=Prorops nasuta TaxID=863751 RepID=UPI0034CD7E44
MAAKGLIILTSVLAAVLSVYAEEPENLVGASIAAPYKYPFIVSIRINGYHHCGGSIISSKVILTAGHCVEPSTVRSPGTTVTVVSGSNYLNGGGNVHYPQYFFVHPYYRLSAGSRQSFDYQYDIGAILLKSPIRFSYAQREIALPVGPPPPMNSQLKVIGWGGMNMRRQIPNELRELDTYLVDNEACKRYLYSVTQKQICTFRNYYKGICEGDSGGPLVYNNRIIGIASASVNCASQGYPDIFTNETFKIKKYKLLYSETSIHQLMQLSILCLSVVVYSSVNFLISQQNQLECLTPPRFICVTRAKPLHSLFYHLI